MLGQVVDALLRRRPPNFRAGIASWSWGTVSSVLRSLLSTSVLRTAQSAYAGPSAVILETQTSKFIRKRPDAKRRRGAPGPQRRRRQRSQRAISCGLRPGGAAAGGVGSAARCSVTSAVVARVSPPASATEGTRRAPQPGDQPLGDLASERSATSSGWRAADTARVRLSDVDEPQPNRSPRSAPGASIERGGGQPCHHPIRVVQRLDSGPSRPGFQLSADLACQLVTFSAGAFGGCRQHLRRRAPEARRGGAHDRGVRRHVSFGASGRPSLSVATPSK